MEKSMENVYPRKDQTLPLEGLLKYSTCQNQFGEAKVLVEDVCKICTKEAETTSHAL